MCLNLVEARSPELTAKLCSGELDVAVLSDSEGQLSDELELEPLMEDPLYVAMARSYPLAEKPDLELADLQDETWVEGRGSTVATRCAAPPPTRGSSRKIAIETTQWLGKQGLVAAGLGIMLIPTIVLDSVRDDIVLLGLGPPRACAGRNDRER